MDYWEIEIGQIASNRIRQMTAFIMICKTFGLPTNLEVFRKIFDIKPLKEGPHWYTFHKKNGVEKFIRKLPEVPGKKKKKKTLVAKNSPTTSSFPCTTSHPFPFLRQLPFPSSIYRFLFSFPRVFYK